EGMGVVKSAPAAKGRKEDEETARLRQEIAESKAHANTMTQEYEAANEELSALNEELQSSNEEMQSINEEMETAREELQSTNEELTTVNDELQSRNEETTQLNNDLFNVLRGVGIPIIILGSELQIRRFNDAAARLLNLIPSDAGRPLGNIRTNVNIPDLHQMVHDVINTLVIKQREVQDDSNHWYSLTIRPYKTVDNRIDGVLMTLVDIDDIKRNLVRVKEAYDYANAIVETVREPLLILDSGLKVITANRSFYKNFLVDPEETEGRHIYELGNGQWNVPDLMKQLQEILPEDKACSDLEIELELPNIGRRVMILNARKIYREEPYVKTALNMMEHFDRLILLAIEDITERKQAEGALQKSNTFNQSIIDSSYDCIKLLDLEGRLQYMSPGGQRQMGIRDMGKYLNVPYQEFWKDTDHQTSLEALHKAQQGQIGTFQGFCPTVDGSPKWWNVAITPVIGADGKPERLLAVSRDITERKESEEALKRLNQKLQFNASELKAAYKDMESFSYAASHDLRSPLITIAGFSNILLEDYAEKLDDKGKDYLNRINNSVKKMNQLIADLLNFSKVSTKEILKHDFNMDELTQTLVNELKPAIGERDILFEIKQMPSAYGDLAMISQVLVNLLSNAIKFTHSRETAIIEVGGYTENVENVYYVQDNGIGFDMQFSNRLFSLFQRIHTSREIEGTGVGLVLVKSIVEKHGGRVWAEGKPDEGARFCFTLPGKEK
ncbi:MAG: PAS domain-containing protein, partial [Thermodesulfovibrionales bacterium]